MKLERYTEDGHVETLDVPDLPAEQQNSDALQQRADQAISALETAYAGRQAGVAPSPAILWLTVRVVCALARLVLNRTESAG